LPINSSSWSKSQPSGQSSIRDGDDQIRSDKSLVEALFNDEHYFDPQTSASSASGGLHRKGSARIFTNATRASLTTPASADSNGKLAYCDDLQSLHLLGTSSATTINWGCDPPGSQVYSAQTTTFGSGTTVQIRGLTENWDVGSYGTGGFTPSFTVPSGFSGRHVLVLNCQVPSFLTGTIRASIVRSNGVVAQQSIGTHVSPGGLSLSHIDRCAEGETYRADFFQDSGVNLSLNSIYFTISRT
jgi:hypothetical protein